MKPKLSTDQLRTITTYLEDDRDLHVSSHGKWHLDSGKMAAALEHAGVEVEQTPRMTAFDVAKTLAKGFNALEPAATHPFAGTENDKDVAVYVKLEDGRVLRFKYDKENSVEAPVNEDEAPDGKMASAGQLSDILTQLMADNGTTSVYFAFKSALRRRAQHLEDDRYDTVADAQFARESARLHQKAVEAMLSLTELEGFLEHKLSD